MESKKTMGWKHKSTNKLSEKQQAKIGKVMHEFKEGELHSGSKKGPIVTDRDQAIAIALSEANASKKMVKGGYTVPAYDVKTTGVYLFKTKNDSFYLLSYLFERENETEDSIEIQDDLRDKLGSILIQNSSWKRLASGKPVKARSSYSGYIGTLTRIDDTRNVKKYVSGTYNDYEFKNGGGVDTIMLEKPYRNGNFQEDMAKENIEKIFNNVSFRKFGNEFRKHVSPGFTQENNADRLTANYRWSEFAGYIIGDGSYYVTEEEYNNFIKNFNTKYDDNYGDGGGVSNNIDKGLEQFKNDEISEGKDASIHLAHFNGKSIKAQSTDKSWPDGVPVTKYFSRNGFKTISPNGQYYILESDSWWYFKIGKTWYAVKKSEYGTPPFEYGNGGKMVKGGGLNPVNVQNGDIFRNTLNDELIQIEVVGIDSNTKQYILKSYPNSSKESEETLLPYEFNRFYTNGLYEKIEGDKMSNGGGVETTTEIEAKKLSDKLKVVVVLDNNQGSNKEIIKLRIYPNSKPGDRFYDNRAAQSFLLNYSKGKYEFLTAGGYNRTIQDVAKLLMLPIRSNTGYAGRSSVDTSLRPVNISQSNIKKIVKIMQDGLRDESKSESDYYKKMSEGGELDKMSLAQLLDMVPIFEQMHIEGYSEFTKQKMVYDDFNNKTGNKHLSFEEKRFYDEISKRKLKALLKYKENIIEWIKKHKKAGKMSEGGGIKKYTAKKEQGNVFIYENGEKYGYLKTQYDWDSNAKKDKPYVAFYRLSDNKMFRTNYIFQKDAFQYVKDTGELFFELNDTKMSEGGDIKSNYIKKTYSNLIEKPGILSTKTNFVNKKGVKLLEYGYDYSLQQEPNTLFYYSWDFQESQMSYESFRKELVDFFVKTYHKPVKELKSLYVGWDRKEKDTYANGGYLTKDDYKQMILKYDEEVKKMTEAYIKFSESGDVEKANKAKYLGNIAAQNSYKAKEMWRDSQNKMAAGGKINIGDTWEWHGIEYDQKKGGNYKVVKQVLITNVDSKGQVKGRFVGTANDFIVREPGKYLKKKVSSLSKMSEGGGVSNKVKYSVEFKKRKSLGNYDRELEISESNKTLNQIYNLLYNIEYKDNGWQIKGSILIKDDNGVQIRIPEFTSNLDFQKMFDEKRNSSSKMITGGQLNALIEDIKEFEKNIYPENKDISYKNRLILATFKRKGYSTKEIVEALKKIRKA
jgi:hypothetical protein